MEETHRTRFPVTFSRLNLDELSKELDRRTKETQMLQEEVEHATKQALESAGGLNNTLPQSCLTTMFDMDDSVLQPLGYDQDDLSSEVTRRSLSFQEEEGISLLKEVLENPVEEGSKEELSQLHKQLEETRARYEHLRFHFLQTVVRLETELQEVQVERDVLSDLRMKDLRQRSDQMDRMRGGIQSISWSDSGDHQRLHESRSLARTLESVEQTFKRVYSDLVAREKQAGLCDSVTSLGHAAACPGDDTASPDQFPPEVKATKAAEQLGSEQLKYQGKATMMLQEKKDRNQAESHACLNECQVIELESALSLYKDKVCSLERQLSQAQSQMDEAFMRQAERLESQRVQITSELRQAHDDLSREKERSEQLGVSCVGLCATVEELHEELDQRSRLVQRLQTFREDCQARMETLGRASLEEARGRCGALQAEADGLRLQLGDREKALELLRLQTEGDVQTTVQHGRIMDTLHQERNHLTDQLNERTLEVQQLRAELAERDSGLAALEQDRRELQASLAEQRRRFQQATLEKRQLAARVNAQRTQLLLLSEGHNGDVLKLRSQLKSSHAELEQAKRSLRTLEGADGHGLQVAMGMQKRITEGREQMDSLQGRIQQQEAAMEELYQEKHCQDLESQRQVQMLLSLREDKRRLVVELLALRSNERRLQDRASSLEAALHKMSESFADCQDGIHLQEQEFIRLKLQHALDLKERQGQDLHSPATAVSSSVLPVVPPALAAIPPSYSTRQASRNLKKPKAQKLKERLTQELRPQVKELRGSFSENCRPHTGSTTACSLLRRESTPESTHRTTLELHLQRTPDRNHHHSAFISGTPLGRRSPVHSLLTSVPDVELLRHRPEAIRIPTYSEPNGSAITFAVAVDKEVSRLGAFLKYSSVT